MLLRNYNKPGKGVPKEEPKKLGIVIYAEIVVRKFWKFLQAGVAFTLLSLPWLIVLYIGSYFMLRTPITLVITDMDRTQAATIVSMLCSTMALLITILWGAGPVSAAFSFVMRSFVREEPIWLISDGKKALKENMKQGFLVTLTDVIVLVLCALASESCWMLIQIMPSMQKAVSVIMYLLLFMLALYTIMHPYIYQLMITFDCSFGELYKNAMLLSFAKLPLNVLFMLIAAAIIIVPIWVFGIYPVFVGVILLSVGFIVTRFPPEFYAIRVIKREMLDKQQQQ